MKRKNVNITLAVLAATAAFIVFCPLPYRVICPIEIKPRDADPVYADVGGVLENIYIKPWQQVQVGDKLGRLSNPELQLEIADLEAKLAVQRTTADVLHREQFDGRNELAARELPEVEKSVQSLEEQLEQKREDLEGLNLVARSAGTVLPPPEVHPPAEKGEALPTFSGSPLEAKNLGAYLSGVLFCQIGDPTRWEANIVVDQDDIEFVHQDQEVAIKLDGIPHQTFYTKISAMGPKMETTSRQLSSKGGGGLMSKVDEDGTERPINPSYQANAPLDDTDGNLIQGMRGTAKVYANWQPLGKRLWRYLIRTFNFKL